nr:uncharacterized protein LOC113824043 [Penaeus vannamei]
MTAAVVGMPGGAGGLTEELRAVPGSSEGVTPLMYACQQNRDHTVRQILHRKPASVHERDRTGKTALHYCAENPTLACIDQVSDSLPSRPILCNLPSCPGGESASPARRSLQLAKHTRQPSSRDRPRFSSLRRGKGGYEGRL